MTIHCSISRLFLPCVIALLTGGAQAQEVVTFEKDVQPIFAKRCFGCHSPQAQSLKGKLDLSTIALALKGGEHGAVILPGDADKSPLVQMIEWRIEPEMPPKTKFEKLAQAEIDVIRQWIASGAKSAEGIEAAAAPVEMAAAPVTASTHAAPISAVAFSPDGSLLARGTLHAVDVLKIDPATGAEEKVRTLEGHAEMVRALAFTPDGTLLAAAGGQPGRGGEVKIWNVSSGELVRTISGHVDNILDVAIRPDGRQLATCSYDRLVKIWSLDTGEELHTLKDHVDAVFSLAYSPDGKVLASGAGDRTVKLWDAETGARLITLSDSTDSVMAVAFSPSGQYIAAGAADKMIRIWDVLESGEGLRQGGLTSSVLVKSAFAHQGPVLQLAYSADGKTLYSASEDRHVKAWDAESMTERLVFETQSDWVQALTLSSDGERLAVGRYDATSAIYKTADGAKLWPAEAMQVADAGTKPSKRNLNVDAVFINATIPPSISGINPVRQHRGSEFELTVDGKNLGEGQPFFTDAGIKAEVVSSEALPIPEFTYNPARLDAQIFDYAQPYRYKLKVTLPADAAPGDRFLMFRTPLGLTNPSTLRVLSQPDIGEVEPNDTGNDATPLAIPSTVIGALNSAEDVDRFRVQVQAGQELVFVVTDSTANTVLRLRDAQGNVLARSEDFGNPGKPRIGYRFEQAGDYFIEFSDAHFRGGLGYRLHVGAFPYVSRVEPLGIPAGPPQKVKVAGFNIGGLTEMEVDPPDTAAPGQTIGLPLPGYEANPVDSAVLAVAQFPEIEEAGEQIAVAPAQALAFPSVVNGRIDATDGAAEQDVFRFSAKKGETVVLQTEAASLGSPLDSVLEILDLDGRVLQRAQARCVAQTVLTLSDRDSKSGGLRVQDWSDFRVNDYVMVGSEILRARRLPGYADEDMNVVSYAFPQRMGFFGTTPEFHAVGAPVYKVEIHPLGMEFPPNGMPVFPIYWRNDDTFEEGKPRGDSRLDFEAPADGDYLVRVGAADGVGGTQYQYRLMLRPLQPDFDVVVDPYWINVDPGVSEPVTVRVRRRDGFSAPVQVKLLDLPEGLTAAENTIVEGEDDVVLALDAAPGAASTGTDATFRVVATSTLGGAEVTREARIGAITVSQKQPDLIVQADKEILALQPGETGQLAVTLARNNGFTSRVPISVLNLPFGVQVMNTGLNGILVREGELTRGMEIHAEPWVKPGKYTIYVQARIESTSPGRLLFISRPLVLELIGPAEKVASATGS